MSWIVSREDSFEIHRKRLVLETVAQPRKPHKFRQLLKQDFDVNTRRRRCILLRQSRKYKPKHKWIFSGWKTGRDADSASCRVAECFSQKLPHFSRHLCHPWIYIPCPKLGFPQCHVLSNEWDTSFPFFHSFSYQERRSAIKRFTNVPNSSLVFIDDLFVPVYVD